MKRLAVPSSDIPAHVFQRIRGRLFFDGGFEVSQNKLYLVRTSNIFRVRSFPSPYLLPSPFDE